MANHLRICIVGGRSFGKTALVKSVARISGFLPLNNKGRLVELLNTPCASDEWRPTGWKDVRDWQFKFTFEEGKECREKILSFAD